MTGSTGFVGGHLVEHLLGAGASVTCLSRQTAGRAGTRHKHVSDYLDVDTLTDALRGSDVVVHLAARAHVLDEDAADPEKAFRAANFESARAVAQAARAAGVRRLVLVSSIGVNGDRTVGRPFTETDAPHPRELYATSKWEGEQAVARELAQGQTDFVVLRPPLVYGDGCPGNFHLLLRLVDRLPLIPLGGLRRRRSLIHIDNLCDAILIGAAHPAVSRGTYVLSDNLDLSVAEVARILAAAFGKRPARVIPVPEVVLRWAAGLIGKRAAVDKLAGELIVDPSAFLTATGWRPPVAPAAGLARTALAYAAAARQS